MFRTNLKFAIRNLRSNKRHAFLNIVGLSVAIAACLVIYLVVDHEYSYDTYHRHAKQVFEVVKKQTTPDGEEYSVATPLPMTAALRTDFPGVKFSELFNSYGSQITVMADARTNSNKKFVEKTGVFYADSVLFECFDVTWLAGNRSALANDNVVVLSRSVADKYFGAWQEAMGKFIKIDNTVTLQVAGIIGDPPDNTDFPFTVVASYRSFDTHLPELGFAGMKDQWGASTSNHQIYALLPEAVTAASIDNGLKSFVPKYLTSHLNKSQKVQLYLQPLSNIHFDTRFSNNGTHVSSKTSLNTLAFIGILILLMACINFVNLSTALAVKRSKEVGIRKVMGSSSGQLAGQVFSETLLLVSLSAIAALGLAYLSLPYLKYLVQIEGTLTLFRPWNMAFLCCVIIVTTFLSAAYPASVLSRFKPIEAMRNKINTTKLGNLSLRRVLVVFQFCFSQILIIATIIALRQMHYVQNADLGFNKESIILLHGNNDSASVVRLDAFKRSLLTIPGVSAVTCSFDPPSSGNNWNSNFGFDQSSIDKDFFPDLKFADADYAKTYGLKMKAGRFYNNDSLPELVINETLCRKLGFQDPSTIIGKTLRIGGGKWQTVVGVVKDFKNNSLRDDIHPTIISKVKKFYALTGIKLQTAAFSDKMDAIRKTWDSYFPEYAFNAEIMDEVISRFYEQEQRMSTLYKVYASLAILISCLGLYGLVSFMAVQKTKEVGIRKVLGASLTDILFLFSKEFTILVIIAFLIAVPAGYYMMQNWLERFVFRINPGVGVFILAIALSLLLAWITVGYKAIKAAMANPVNSLRSE